MADEKRPSTLEMLAGLLGKASLYIPVAGQFVQIAEVGIESLAAYLDTSGADIAELQKIHAEYLRRKALAADPNA